MSESRKPYVARTLEPAYNTVTLVQSVFPAKLKYTGAKTGKLYVWEKSGDVIPVDNADLDDLLSKKVGAKGCCGDNLNGNPLFQIMK